MTFGINVHVHPYCACVLLTDCKTISAMVYFVSASHGILRKLSALLCILFPPAMVFYGRNKKGKFSSKRTLICRGKSDFYAMSSIHGGNDRASNFYNYLNENKHG